MARNMKFIVKNHPTKDVPGITTVTDEHIMDDGSIAVVTMGELTKVRGTDGYDAAFLDGKTLTAIGSFGSKSQAGHAVRQSFEADLRSEKVAARTTVKSTKTAKVDPEQAKRDKRNARKRELRAAKKAAA